MRCLLDEDTAPGHGEILTLLRYPSQRDDGLEQARAFLWRWREIHEMLNQDAENRLATLTTLSGQTFQVGFSSVDDLSAMPGPRPSS